MKRNNIKPGSHIRKLRISRGETLHNVSIGTDIDSPLLSKIERGIRLPTEEQIKQLARYFGLNESELKVLVTAEKIIRKYGISETTYDAIQKVEEQIIPYIIKKRGKL